MQTERKSPLYLNYIITWLPVFSFIIVAITIRCWLNSSANYLLIGGDGPYYPLQVRSIMENGRLALPDMPLLFMIEAFVAKVLLLFNVSDTNGCVIIAIKFIDAVFPPLAAIPVFLISKELYTKGVKSRLLSYLLVGFSIINITTTHIFSSGLQKNGFAVVWMFIYLYFLIKFLKTEQRNYIWHSLFVLVLCAFTHFGCFSILLFFTLVIITVSALYNKQRIRHFNIRNAIAILIILSAMLAIIGYFDPNRLDRLIHIPIRLFEFPVYLLAISGFNIADYLSPLHMIISNFLALIAVAIIIKCRKNIEVSDKVIVVSFIIITFTLASPLLGLEWANRLHIMSYLSITIVYLVIFNKIKTAWIKVIPAVTFLGIILLCSLNVPPNRGCITNTAYIEFSQINKRVSFSTNCVVMGRQDLRLLAAWEFKTKTAADYLLTKEDFKKYDAVYVIRQMDGSNFSKGRPRGDAEIPTNSIKIYSGLCYELYKLNNNDDWLGGMGKPPKAKGTILSKVGNLLVLKNDKTGIQRTIELSSHTKLDNGIIQLKPGMQIEVWGALKPFSLHVIAESIYPYH
jgi:hypothetical protein